MIQPFHDSAHTMMFSTTTNFERRLIVYIFLQLKSQQYLKGKKVAEMVIRGAQKTNPCVKKK